ncbi:DUF2381 family protein [Pyxidicoccus xibeiensis]|uniref:DUF2381 family protein n=1 Tax=Pyxidicoccus xibeiensis TaxID=2906759 RepID=UPI0020A8298C|nr:DUF2381 family protein [Pyxidicoccus xibeiensis]MCP3144408.1 DUF2381 family protein [Pyxidicoccus xibeiensis]
MWRPLPHWLVVLFLLVAFTASARERESAAVRTLLISDHPAQEAHRVSVSGQVATVLRFDQACDAARTRLLGWEGRFEPPAVMGKLVVVVPLRDLAEDERVPLLVTLADGTEFPFLLGPPREGQRVDQQVNVFKDRKSYNAVLSSLYDALGRERILVKENERFRKEETSPDHALAALLASGAVTQTPFRPIRTWLFKEDDADIHIVAYSGRLKAAVLVTLRNHDPKRPWRLKEARLMTTPGGETRTVAIRATHSSIPPREEGRLAFIVDKEAFVDAGKPTQLALELVRHDGLRQALVVLDPRLARE